MIKSAELIDPQSGVASCHQCQHEEIASVLGTPLFSLRIAGGDIALCSHHLAQLRCAAWVTITTPRQRCKYQNQCSEWEDHVGEHRFYLDDTIEER